MPKVGNQFGNFRGNFPHISSLHFSYSSGWSLLTCQPVVPKCSVLETAFLCLATVSTVRQYQAKNPQNSLDGNPQIGLLTTVINNTPIVPQDSSEDVGLMLSDNRQCIMFALFMIWFASITVNLGTTFLSGGLAANADDILLEPSCPILLGPYRHYALNFLWILTIVFCLTLTLYHLRKLRR